MSERTSNANNKTIDRDMLLDFFAAMHKELLECQRIADEEIAKNEPLALDYQEWTMRHFDGSLRFAVYFKDGHEISYVFTTQSTSTFTKIVFRSVLTLHQVTLG